MTQATRSRDCRQEGCECGYYHLHPDLNESIVLHSLASFYYSMLPDEFTTQDVLNAFGYTKTSAASRKCDEFVKNNVCEKIQKGRFRKLAKAI